MTVKNAAKKLLDNLPKLRVAFAKLSTQDVYAGVPRDDTGRSETTGGMNNATLAFIHNNGSPAMNIPERNFMQTGVERAKPRIIKEFQKVAKDAPMSRDTAMVTDSLHRVGLMVQASMRSVIAEGISPALRPSTIRNRFRSRKTKGPRKGELAYSAALAAGSSPEEAQSATGITPLVNTGQLRNAINYVIRKKE